MRTTERNVDLRLIRDPETVARVSIVHRAWHEFHNRYLDSGVGRPYLSPTSGQAGYELRFRGEGEMTPGFSDVLTQAQGEYERLLAGDPNRRSHALSGALGKVTELAEAHAASLPPDRRRV